MSYLSDAISDEGFPVLSTPQIQHKATLELVKHLTFTSWRVEERLSMTVVTGQVRSKGDSNSRCGIVGGCKGIITF